MQRHAPWLHGNYWVSPVSELLFNAWFFLFHFKFSQDFLKISCCWLNFVACCITQNNIGLVFVGKRCSDVCFTKEQNRIPRSTVTSLSIFRKSTTRYGHAWLWRNFSELWKIMHELWSKDITETCADLLSTQTNNRPFPQWDFSSVFSLAQKNLADKRQTNCWLPIMEQHEPASDQNGILNLWPSEFMSNTLTTWSCCFTKVYYYYILYVIWCLFSLLLHVHTA